MSTLKVNYIQANTTSEIDINSPLGTIPSLDVSGSATIGGNLNITGVSTFTGNSYVAGNLGIGTASPGAKLHLIGNQYLQGGNYFTDTTSGYFWAGNGSFAGGIYGSNSGNVTTIISPQTINLVTSSTQRLSIDSSGRVTIPNQPIFQAYGVSGGTFANGNYWIFPTTLVNIGNHYNTSNGIFTAPVAGTYKFWWSFIGNNVNDVYRYSILKNNASLNFQLRIDTGATGTEYGSNGSYSIVLTLTVNDTIRIYFSSDGGNPSYPASNSSLENFTTFGGQLLG